MEQEKVMKNYGKVLFMVVLVSYVCSSRSMLLQRISRLKLDAARLLVRMQQRGCCDLCPRFGKKEQCNWSPDCHVWSVVRHTLLSESVHEKSLKVSHEKKDTPNKDDCCEQVKNFATKKSLEAK